MRRSPALFEIENGKADEQEDPAIYAADVVREEKNEARVLVQRTGLGALSLWGAGRRKGMWWSAYYIL